MAGDRTTGELSANYLQQSNNLKWERCIYLDVLVLLSKESKVSDHMNLCEQLSPKAKLCIFESFQTAVQVANDRRYLLIVFLTYEEAFPVSWKVNDLLLESPTMILTKANKVHIQLMNHWINMISTYSDQDNHHSLFNKSLEYIEQNLCESMLSLEMVASHIYVSKFHYSRLFQKYVGVGFKEYIISRRIEIAKNLLEKGEQVTNVCYLVGYNDLTHFSRVFKRVVGTSPSIYQKTRTEFKNALRHVSQSDYRMIK
jgi:YesN/AraC family two-component response regulator